MLIHAPKTVLSVLNVRVFSAQGDSSQNKENAKSELSAVTITKLKLKVVCNMKKKIFYKTALLNSPDELDLAPLLPEW